MPPEAGVVAQSDRIAVKPMAVPGMVQQSQRPVATAASDAFARDAIIAWFRGEFAAANAIIDAICSHLTQLEGDAIGSYDSVFTAIHRRRLNWIPILQMQKYYSIADVTQELKKVSDKKKAESVVEVPSDGCTEVNSDMDKKKEKLLENSVEHVENGGGEVVDEDFTSEITDAGSQDVQPLSGHANLCSNHEECEARRAKIKMIKGFIAKEPVRGHMMNVVRGLKLYEDAFTDVELSKLNDFVSELRVAGQNGELSGDTFILYNLQMKGNRRELVQLGVPIFGQVKKEETNEVLKDMTVACYIEPIPHLLQAVIDHLVQWRLIPENRKPNSCIINFFDEGEYSQPFLKPPHLEQPISTLLLSDSSMAFGRMLVGDGEGHYRGPLVLPLKEGSILVMRGNSSDTARHAMCNSLNKRVTITFFRVRPEIETNPPLDAPTPLSKAMTLWQPAVEPMGMIPKWGLVRAPMMMVAPMRPVVLGPKRIPGSGTGVFLPWTVGSRKHVKHLPPRAQRGRLMALSSSPHKLDSAYESSGVI